MNLDELRAVQSKERQTDSLQHLRASFYADAAEYIAELEAERDRRASEAEDPFADPAVRRLTDEVETAREVAEAIYDRRLGKLVKRASLTAADIPADEDGLTEEERELFDDLVDRIETNKGRVLDVLDGEPKPDAAASPAAGDADTGPDGPGAAGEDAGLASATGTDDERDRRASATAEGSTPGDQEPAPDESAAAGGGEAPPVPPETEPTGTTETDDLAAEDPPDAADLRRSEEQGGDGDDPEADGGPRRATGGGLGDRTTVRVTGEVDPFFGVDEREYDLDPEEVVSLPAENAEPLLQSGDAERLD